MGVSWRIVLFLLVLPIFPPAIRKNCKISTSRRRSTCIPHALLRSYICIYIYFLYIFIYIFIFISVIYLTIYSFIRFRIQLTPTCLLRRHRKHVNVYINCHDVFPPTIYSRGIKFLSVFLRASMYDGVMYVYYACRRVCVYVCARARMCMTQSPSL